MRHAPDFSAVNVVVVGDVMLDRFWSGGTTRVSPEAPVPVVKVERCMNRAGGAGNVAVNIATLGSRVTLAGLCGQDDAAQSLKEAVQAANVRWSVTPCDADTIVKLRVLSRNQQLLRMDFEASLEGHADELFTAYVRTLIADADIVVLSDYAKGTLARVSDLISACVEANTPVLVDPKGMDLSRYAHATLLTPNLAEFEAVVGACHSEEELVAKGEALREELSLQALLVTRSEQGMTLIERGQPPLHLPARAREVFDVTGAGDTVISVLAASIATGESLASSTALANAAAGVVVGKVGTAAVTREELEQALSRDLEAMLPHEGAVVSEDQLLYRVAQARAAGERIVMTNGCFDLLHPGHVHYLEAARRLGDRLIVAVNTDDSVRRLKGPTRPVNDLAARMSVLAGLRSVDWVVAFDEDTPARLIAEVVPDVLTKGGDYRPEQVVGFDTVVAAGGKVVIMDFVDGHSTSSTLERIHERDT